MKPNAKYFLVMLDDSVVVITRSDSKMNYDITKPTENKNVLVEHEIRIIE